MVQQDLSLPEGTRLLHIGPHKTGTTAAQRAFAAASDRLGEHGVRYFGEGAEMRSRPGVLAITGSRTLLGTPPLRMANWNRLVTQVAAAGDDRVLVSSEFFANADQATARRVVTDLGGPRAHVLVTLRPLARIVASQWQQYVQNGLRMSYERWLDHVLNKPPYTVPSPLFWRRHMHDELVQRWVDVVGPDRVTVVVADDSDRTMLLRTLEALLALPDGFLVPNQAMQNRSLTYGEVEFVRLLNREFRRLEWPEGLYARYVRKGALWNLKGGYRPSPDEPKIRTPRWALKRVAEIAAKFACNIEASGVNVIGDLDSLGRWPDERTDEPESSPTGAPMVAAAAVVQAVVGIIGVSHEAEQEARRLEAEALPAADPETLSTRDRRVREVATPDLFRVLLRRGRRRAGKALHRSGHS